MMTVDRAIARIRYVANSKLHRIATASVLKRAPARVSSGGPTIVSMVGSSQLYMYLCAIKSFAQHLQAARYAVLDDGSLTESDRSILRDHVEGIRIFPISEVDTGTAPRGGCWERLLLISEIGREEYVVQLDSDTLTIGTIPEVATCVRSRQAFTLITSTIAKYCSLSDAATAARQLKGDHFQFVAERALAQLPDPDRGRYVRGCAAFAGFPAGTAGRSAILEFSGRMERILGNRWHEWGSEQVTSNWVVANAQNIGDVPYPRYRNYEGQPVAPDTAFLHFIGTFRHAGPGYRRFSREVIRRLP